MSASVTLYKFKIDLSHIDQGIYTQIEFRVAQHPSESLIYLLTRVIAFAHNAQTDRLEFSPEGLNDPEVPAIRKIGDTGTWDLWIEIGSPSAKKLHKATKKAKVVKVYTYKDPRVLMKEMGTELVHKLDTVQFYSISQRFLEKIQSYLKRDNQWTIVFLEGMISITIGELSEQTELISHNQFKNP
jgi:uncharacterized protein YaeQ